ncbi:MAG: hypothetical protein SXV54_24685 [Chloroflexota bacterium]|nr:hypothetical protein [Chloroflexota bacterium]
MNQDRLLTIILGVLTLSVLITGGLAIYLTLAQAEEQAPPATGQPEVSSTPTTQDVEEVTGEPRIAFVSDREGDTAIYTVNSAGSHVQRVSAPDWHFCLFPSWSPDGQRVAYVATEEGPTDEGENDAPSAILVSAADGSGHILVSQAISNTDFIRPTWSPDGTRLAFVSWRETEASDDPTSIIHIARTDGSGIERSLAFPSEIQHLAWSPVEDKLVVVSGDPDTGTYVHVMSSDGSGITEVFRRSMMADWTPDGRSVVVGGYMSEEIIVIDVSSQDEQTPVPRTVGTLPLQPLALAMSPDGAHVAVVAAGHHQQGYATTVAVVTVETGEVATVAEGSGWIGWPHWSADGQSMVFTWGQLNRGPGLPRANLWVYDVVSGQLQELTTEERFEGLGVWSP